MRPRGRFPLPLLPIAVCLLALGALARHATRTTAPDGAYVPPPTRIPVHRQLVAPPPAGVPPALVRLAARGDDRVRLVVFLEAEPIVRLARSAAPGERVARATSIRKLQDRVLPQIERVDGALLARLRNLAAGLVVSLPAKRAVDVAALPGVTGVAELLDYELHLDSTVPFVGADTLHDLGYDGSGVVIAVIDSGVDYTHADLGGSGDPADFVAATVGADPGCLTGFEPVCAASSTPPPGSFPTAKVLGGFDWVGEQWTGSDGPAESPDPNPIDQIGHGTHVAGTIAGTSGVAPGTAIYALKTCSSQNFNCSGLGVVQALEFATDPDGNPGTADQVDVINLSLGSSYGQGEDALAYFANEAVGAGIVVVASAGELGDRPFVATNFCMNQRVLCVGAEHRPGKLLYTLETGGDEVPILQEYYSTAPFEVLTGALDHIGSGCTAPGDLTGQIAIAYRGGCSYDLKAQIAESANALALIVADTRAESPYQLPDGDFPGFNTNPAMPMFTTSTASGALLAQADGATATIDVASGVPLTGWMTGFSSRGPSWRGLIKPDITAPGAADSPRWGSGTGTSLYAGTSMAAPHVSGAAALLLDENPALRPEEVRMRLIATAHGGLRAGLPGSDDPAPLTWSGAGSLDVADALDPEIFFWHELPETEGSLADRQPGLAWPYTAAASSVTDTETVWFFNPTGNAIDVSVSTRWNDPGESAQGVTVTFPEADFVVGSFAFAPRDAVLTVLQPTQTPPAPAVTPMPGPTATPTPGPTATPTPVPSVTTTPQGDWAEVDRGANGYNGYALGQVEYDGWYDVTINGVKQYSMPWTVIVKRAADLSGTWDPTAAPAVTGSVLLDNDSTVNNGTVEWFVNIDNSENRYGHVVGQCASSGLPPGCGDTPVDLASIGVGMPSSGGEPTFELAVTLHDAPYRSSGAVVQLDARFDTDLDGTYDTALFNSLLSDGRNGAYAFNFDTSALTAVGYLDSDFNSSAYVLRAPAALLGLAPGTEFDLLVLAWDDWLADGLLWDCSPFPPPNTACGTLEHRMTFGEERFRVHEDYRRSVVAVDGQQNVPFDATVQAAAASPSHIGLLALYRNAPVGQEAQAFVLVQPGVDDDGDGRGNASDCAPDDPGVFAAPGEVPVPSLVFPNRTTFVWQPVNADAGSGTQYVVFQESGGFGAVGNAPDAAFSAALDAPLFDLIADPAPGQVIRVLVRATNACGAGPWGFDSQGAPRTP